MAMDKIDVFPFITPPLITFLVGLGMIINGMMFTVPRKKLPGNADDAWSQRMLDAGVNRPPYEVAAPANMTNELAPSSKPQLTSITEHTTHHLNTRKS